MQPFSRLIEITSRSRYAIAAATAITTTIAIASSTAAQCRMATLITSDGSDSNAAVTVDTSGDWVALAAYEHEQDLAFQGAVYMFSRDGSEWGESQKIIPSNTAAFDNFGVSVGISGDSMIVGSSKDMGNATVGAAYIYELNQQAIWVETQFLQPSDSAPGQQFGSKVDIDGNYAVVADVGVDSSAGAVYVYVRQGSNWVEQQKLTASDAQPLATFGTDVAISGNRIIVGANNFSDSRSVYIFERTGNSWSETTKLIPNSTQADDYYGGTVAIDGDTAVVGAYLADNDDDPAVGRVDVFEFAGASWNQTQELRPPGNNAFSFFGGGLGIKGDRLLIGSEDSTNGYIHVFKKSSGIWSQTSTISEGDALFNVDLAIDTFAVGTIRPALGVVYDIDSVATPTFDLIENQSLLTIEFQFPGEPVQTFQIHMKGSIQGLLAFDCATPSTLQIPMLDIEMVESGVTLVDPNGAEGILTGVRATTTRPGPPANLTDLGNNNFQGMLNDYEIEIDVNFDEQENRGNSFRRALIAAILDCLMDIFSGGGVNLTGTQSMISIPDIDFTREIDFGLGAGNPTMRVTGDLVAEIAPASTPADLQDIAITTGQLISGDLAEITDSDDAYLRARSAFGFLSSEPNVMTFKVMADTDLPLPDSFDLNIESRLNNPGGNVTVRALNQASDHFEVIDSYSLGTTELTHTVADIAADPYIGSNDGMIEVEVKHVVIATFSLSGFVASIDQVEFLVRE